MLNMGDKIKMSKEEWENLGKRKRIEYKSRKIELKYDFNGEFKQMDEIANHAISSANL